MRGEQARRVERRPRSTVVVVAATTAVARVVGAWSSINSIKMGSSNGTGSLSPTTSERDCSTKKRFSQTCDALSSSSTETLLLSGLEAGVLSLDSPGGSCGGGVGSGVVVGSSSNGSSKGNSGVGLFSSSGGYGSSSDHARLPLRARISEVSAFVAVFALIASSAMQIAMVWVSFWMRVEEIRTRSVSFHRRTVAFPLWGLWVAALLGYRRMIYKRIAPDMAKLFMHAEILALVVLGMTGEFLLLYSFCLCDDRRACMVTSSMSREY